MNPTILLAHRQAGLERNIYEAQNERNIITISSSSGSVTCNGGVNIEACL